MPESAVQEEWRPVKGFPKFQINRDAQVRNKNTGNLVSVYKSEIDGEYHPAVMLAHRGVERRVWLQTIYMQSF